MDLLDIWLQHEVTAEPYVGTDGHGRAVYGAAVTVACFKVDKRRLVRSAQTGEQVISETTVYAPLDTTAFTTNGKVTLPDGRVATVLNVQSWDAGDLPLPECVEVVLT